MTTLRSITGNEEAVHRIWNPRSIAFVGASSKEGSLAWWPQHLAQQYGYAGRVVSVNPNRTDIEGVPCVPSVAAIGEPVDVAVITLDAAGTANAVRECAELGVGAVVLPAQGFGESSAAGKQAEQEMLAVTRAAGMRMHGPNSDGVANFGADAVMSIQPVLGQGIRSGNVAVVTQSGATAASIVSRLADEEIGVRYYASAGNEVDLGFADYLSVALQDPEVKIVVAFIEAIRRPDDFVKVARLAAELGKPIVAIKVGRTAQAAARAAAHTGALAGEDRIYQALFDSLGVIRVDELSELVAVTKLHLAASAEGRTPIDQNIAIMSVSGGQAGALADRSAAYGLTLPEVGPSTAERLEELFPHGNALNPCDLTGDVAKNADLAAQAYQAFESDGGVGLLVYARKELTGEMGRLSAARLAEAASAAKLSLAVYSMDGPMNADERATYAAAGVPTFTSASELFVAVQKLATFNARRVAPEPVAPAPKVDLSGAPAGVVPDLLAKELLSAYGLQLVGEVVAGSVDDAVAAATEVGLPVVMKVVSDRIAHKTEMGGVIVGVSDVDQVREAYATLVERARAHLGGDDPDGILVQQMVTDGVEIITGLVHDDQFGPFVLVGTGGVTAELVNDVVLRPAPVSEEEARRMVEGLRGFALLDGFRGAPKGDVEALAHQVSRLSALGHHHADRISELDLNPVLVRPEGAGAVAVDALVVLKGADHV